MAEMGGCRFLVSPPPHNYGGESDHPPIFAPQAKFFWFLPPILWREMPIFAKLCLILGKFTPPYRMGGRRHPPIFSDDGGGIVFSPPYFQTLGGESPPHDFDPWGGGEFCDSPPFSWGGIQNSKRPGWGGVDFGPNSPPSRDLMGGKSLTPPHIWRRRRKFCQNMGGE